jgi:hypothetical protein
MFQTHSPKSQSWPNARPLPARVNFDARLGRMMSFIKLFWTNFSMIIFPFG